MDLHIEQFVNSAFLVVGEFIVSQKAEMFKTVLYCSFHFAKISC